MFSLRGRTALVTGAGSGIGAAVAKAMARAGAAVVVSDLDSGAASTVADTINADAATRAEGGRVAENMAQFDAAEIARSVVELYEPLAEEAGVSLSVEAPGSLKAQGARNPRRRAPWPRSRSRRVPMATAPPRSRSRTAGRAYPRRIASASSSASCASKAAGRGRASVLA